MNNCKIDFCYHIVPVNVVFNICLGEFDKMSDIISSNEGDISD